MKTAAAAALIELKQPRVTEPEKHASGTELIGTISTLSLDTKDDEVAKLVGDAQVSQWLRTMKSFLTGHFTSMMDTKDKFDEFLENMVVDGKRHLVRVLTPEARGYSDNEQRYISLRFILDQLCGIFCDQRK